MWQTNLVKLYCAVCDNSSTIEAEMQRQSNNFRPEFTDEECITVYLWGISHWCRLERAKRVHRGLLPHHSGKRTSFRPWEGCQGIV